MPANILNLPSYRITKVTELNHDYHVHAEVAAPITACIHCQSDKIVGFGRRERLIKDIPMHGQRVGIYVDARRIQCRGCDKTFYEILPDVAEGREMTARLAKWIGEQSLKRPFLAISEETGIDEKSAVDLHLKLTHQTA
ncbi:transposase family protein [Undibacterium sp. WLHG33]|uniref:transposase family protein n=1 Tax=Undibacterium sp. WLHG33 TaxID=3412482 RepID=UPI003C2F51F6